MEINKTFTIYKTQNKHGYYTFFENIIKSTIFTKKNKEPTDTNLNDTNLNDTNIIYDKEFIITYNNPILDKYCKLFCISDPNDKNRFFVGINISIGITYGLTGLFLYFDNNIVSDMVIIPEILQVVEYIISPNDIFLYNQSLIILFKNIKLNAYRISVHCFDYYDKLLGHHTDYTDISGIHKIYNNRWIVLNDSIILDIGSVKIEFNKLKYNMYSIINDIISFLIYTANTISSEEYNDGYPRYCVKCNEMTCITSFCNKVSDNITHTVSLGNSYCHNCAIRYSLSKKSWVCCKLINNEENDLCFKNLDSHYNCSYHHSNKKVVYIMNYSGKKPYKNEYELFVMK